MDPRPRTPYPTDVSDDEWVFLAPSLTLMREDAPQRKYPLRELFNGRRSIARTGLQWRNLPHDLPPWPAVHQQTRRWIDTDVFSAIIADRRARIRLGEGRAPQPTATMFDSRTRQRTPESGARAGTGPSAAKGPRSTWPSIRRASSWPCPSRPRTTRTGRRSPTLAEAIQDATGERVTLAYVD